MWSSLFSRTLKVRIYEAILPLVMYGPKMIFYFEVRKCIGLSYNCMKTKYPGICSALRRK